MAPKQPNTGLFVGLNKGHVVTKKELAPHPSDKKGKTSKRVHFVLLLENKQEVAGFAPYEKRITELLKVKVPKIVEDKTFGLKNKSKNVQKYVQSLQQNVQPKPDASELAAKC